MENQYQLNEKTKQQKIRDVLANKFETSMDTKGLTPIRLAASINALVGHETNGGNGTVSLKSNLGKGAYHLDRAMKYYKMANKTHDTDTVKRHVDKASDHFDKAKKHYFRHLRENKIDRNQLNKIHKKYGYNSAKVIYQLANSYASRKPSYGKMDTTQAKDRMYDIGKGTSSIISKIANIFRGNRSNSTKQQTESFIKHIEEKNFVSAKDDVHNILNQKISKLLDESVSEVTDNVFGESNDPIGSLIKILNRGDLNPGAPKTTPPTPTKKPLSVKMKSVVTTRKPRELRLPDPNSNVNPLY